jgi:hypothetical protein
MQRCFYTKFQDAEIIGNSGFHLTDSEIESTLARWAAMTNVGSMNQKSVWILEVLWLFLLFTVWRSISRCYSKCWVGSQIPHCTVLHVSHAAFPASTAKFPPEHSPPNVINYLLTFNETANLTQVLKNFFCCALKQPSFHNITLLTPTYIATSLPLPEGWAGTDSELSDHPTSHNKTSSHSNSVFLVILYYFVSPEGVKKSKRGESNLRKDSHPLSPKKLPRYMTSTRSVPCSVTKERTGVRKDDDIGVSFLIKQGEWATNTEIKCHLFRFLPRNEV